MSCPKIKFYRRGIGLLEVIVALFILGTIGGALVVISLQVASVQNSAKLKNEAAAFAQEAIEQSRNVKSQGWANLVAGCFSDGTLTTPAVDCTDGSPIGSTTFTRYVNVTAPAANQIKVASVVKWMEKGKPQKVEVDTYYYHY